MPSLREDNWHLSPVDEITIRRGVVSLYTKKPRYYHFVHEHLQKQEMKCSSSLAEDSQLLTFCYTEHATDHTKTHFSICLISVCQDSLF